MKEKMSYKTAMERLQKIVEDIEDSDTELDELVIKIQEAKELIALCEEKLKGVEKEVKEALADEMPKRKKK